MVGLMRMRLVMFNSWIAFDRENYNWYKTVAAYLRKHIPRLTEDNIQMVQCHLLTVTLINMITSCILFNAWNRKLVLLTLSN